MLWVLAIIIILILLSLIKAIIGPTIIDRMISINAITTLVCVFILLLAFFHNEHGIVDIALVFMFCAFVGSLWILKVFAPVNWNPTLSEVKSIPDKEESSDVTGDI